jgi:anti-sigma-K factor RskA
MTPDDHERFAHWAASYTLGALDADDRRAFAAHVATCTTCAAELAELAALPGMIAKTTPTDIEHRPDPGRAAAITDAARRELAAMRRQSRRWQLAAVGLAAAAAVLIALLVVDLGDLGSDAPPTQAATVATTSAATTEVAVSPRTWGTEITLDITGLPARPSYQLWAIDTDGVWVSAATWSPTPSGAVRLTGATSTPTAQLDRIVITSNQRDDLLVEATLSA